MDMQTVQQIIGWVQQNVGDRISKQELVRKAQSSSLPQEAKSEFQQLPEGQYTKDSIISTIQSKVMAGVGGGSSQSGSGGGLGGMFGS